MKKYILTIVVSFFIVGGLFLFAYFYQPKGKTYTITLTNKGFEPKTIRIQQYDTVVFTTTLNDAFWPASDLHPTHDVYPEFDPLEPVERTKAWSFTFEKIGKWNFHNHVDPWARGTIYVEK